ncbi:MAG: 5,6-dimethylbenzimidazole synthase [Rhodospirillaceae bacterium]
MSRAQGAINAPAFDQAFLEDFETLLQWRRDVRHFRRDPVPSDLIERLLSLARYSPSVGLSEPWRFVLVETPSRRDLVRRSFAACNEHALQGYDGDQAKLYASLKLSGLDDAPVHLAVFAESDPEQGAGLGRATMPETLCYSVVSAIQTLWLAARAHGLGLGWVSILDPAEVAQACDAPTSWKLVAYLCIGYPDQSADTPELQRMGWEKRQSAKTKIYRV